MFLGFPLVTAGRKVQSFDNLMKLNCWLAKLINCQFIYRYKFSVGNCPPCTPGSGVSCKVGVVVTVGKKVVSPTVGFIVYMLGSSSPSITVHRLDSKTLGTF